MAAGRARVSRASSEGSTSDADDAGLSAVIETLANLLSAPAQHLTPQMSPQTTL